MEPFRIDLNVMLPSSLNIDKTMEQIEEDLGYQREDPSADTYVNYGVNWGYTSAQAESEMDPGLVIAMAAFLILVIFTGYLIIYNIFQISVTGDIRYYGLLKTIGGDAPAAEADHPPAGAFVVRYRLPCGACGRMAGGISAGAAGDRANQPGGNQRQCQRFSVDFSCVCFLYRGYSAALL